MDIQSYISSGVIEQYVLGILPENEAALLECMIKTNPEVAAAIREYQSTLELLSAAQSTPPPPDLKEKIKSQLHFEKPAEISKSEEAELVHKEKSINLKPWLIAASLALLIASIALIITHQNNQSRIQELESNFAKSENQNQIIKSEFEQVKLQNQALLNSNKIELKGVETHPDMLAEVFWEKNSKDVYLVLNNLPQPPSGKQYQLWAIVDGKPVDAGVYPIDSTASIEKMKNIPKAQAFAITLENEGGSVSPTMDEMYVMGKI